MSAVTTRRSVYRSDSEHYIRVTEVTQGADELQASRPHTLNILSRLSIRPIRTAEDFEAVDWATGFANKHGRR